MMNWAYIAITIFFIGMICLFIGRLTQLSYLTITALTLVISGYLLITNPLRAESVDGPLTSQLETIRAKYNVPALGGAIFTTDGLKEMAVTGARKRGDATPVTNNDLWHLGSDTKAMTATLIGSYVTDNKIHWDDKVLAYFPDIAGKVAPAMRDVTLAQILRHQAGLADSLSWTPVSRDSLIVQRQTVSRLALTQPRWPPGTYHYSNFDYVVAAAILEQITGRPWEDLIRDRIFVPLGMASAGFGGLGTPGQIDQPWPHIADGSPTPMNGPLVDNPPMLGPAGTVHMSISDWSKFLVDQLRGGSGMKALLPSEIYTAIQAPGAKVSPSLQYGFGWGILDRSWGGGKVLQHAGSNTMNYCVAWLAPNKKFGVLVVCNQGGDTATKACDEVASLLIQRHKD